MIGKIMGIDQRVFTGTAGENLNQYDPVYLDTDGKYYKAYSDILDAEKPVVAMAAATIVADASGSFYKSNVILTNVAWAFSPGELIYLDLWNGLTGTIPVRSLTNAMTANNLPSPLVVSGDSEASGHEAYKAFDGSVSTYWSPSSGATGWLKQDFGRGRTIQYYSLAVPALSSTEEIEAITRAAAAQITFTGHGLTTGMYVSIANVTQTGFTSITGVLPITRVDDDNFTVAVSTVATTALAGASQAAASVITWTAHGMSNGDSVNISGVTQADWTALNGNHTITYINANSFSVPVDTSGFGTPYNAGTDPGVIGANYKASVDAGVIAHCFAPKTWILEGSNYDQSLTPVDIEGMTRAAACVVTWTGHGMETGQYVEIAGVTQTDWDALNARHAITYIDANSFSIAVDTSGYAGDYVPGTDPGTIAHDDWTTLDSQSSITTLNSTATNYLIASPDSYRYYKLTVSAGLGTTLQIAELAWQLENNNLQVLGHALAATQLEFNPNKLVIGVV